MNSLQNPDTSILCKQEKIVYQKTSNFSLFGFSSKGESHRKAGTPGQDAHSIRIVNQSHPTAIVSIADGVGSCAFSHFGSSIATKIATDYLANVLKQSPITEMSDRQIGNAIRETMALAKTRVQEFAIKYNKSERDFQSTLTTAIYDGDYLYFGHIGDDGIVTLSSDGTLAMATTRNKGEEASSVYPLQSNLSYECRKSASVIDGVILATDGVLDTFVMPDVENNRVYYPFLQYAWQEKESGIELHNGKDVLSLAQKQMAVLNSKDVREKITDDITFISITSPRIRNNPYRFSQKAWDDDSRKYKAAREAIMRRNTGKHIVRSPGGMEP